MKHPPLSSSGHVVVFSSVYPPSVKAASSLVVHELLSCFDPTSFSVIAATPFGTRRSEPTDGHKVSRVMHNTDVSTRLNALWRRIQKPLSTRLASRLVRRLRPSLIVGVYPELEFLSIAQRVAAQERIPWIAYLFDTIALCESKTQLGIRHRQVRADTFREASQICVLSDGMADHYKTKHGVHTSVVTHICPQSSMPPRSACVQNRAFMGGSIYGINQHAAARVAKTLAETGSQLVITTPGNEKQLASIGMHGKHIVHTYYSSLQDYQTALSESAFLVLALDWPDETTICAESMQTIFPTRTMEYLTSGRPILVHCPESYFLARFFTRHRCGLVVSDRSGAALSKACSRLLSDKVVTAQLVERAQETSHVFSADKVASQFAGIVAEAEAMQWGQKPHVVV